jgi:hypothetical protein
VSVDVHREEVREAVDTSRDELDRLAIAAGKEDLRPVFAMYTAVIVYQSSIKSQVKQLENNLFCAEPTAVRIVLRVTDRMIHFASETRDNACLHDAARKHAWLHAQADERALDESAAKLLVALRAALPEKPLASAPSEQAAENLTAAAVAEEIAKEWDNIEQLRQNLNNSVDSTSELMQLHTSCIMQKENAL